MTDKDHRLTIVSKRVPPPSQVNDALVIGLAVLAALGGLLFGIGVLLDLPLMVHGTGLAVGLFCLGLAVRRYFADRYPDVEAIEPRTPAAEDEGVPLADIEPVARRPLLTRVLLGGAALFGIGLLAPVASLGPAPGDALINTAWQRGRRLVDSEGNLIRPQDVPFGGFSTVWPEDAIGEELASVVLLRLRVPPEPPTELAWVVDERVVAYSKVCTHAGCPVGLFRERDSALFCPCHQSTFAAARGAVPTFGPAARALPQLPLGVDDDGYLIALSDFRRPVGPAWG